MIPLRDGRQLHVRVIGRGQPVLMLHGMGMDGSHWLPFVLPYIHRFRFFLPDMRGAGRSSAVTLNQPDVFQNLAEDVQDLVEQHALENFLLVGYSLGASTALHLQRESGFTGVRRYLHIDQAPCVGNRDGWRHGLLGEQQEELFASLRAADALLAQFPQATWLRELPVGAQREVSLLLAEAFAPIVGGSVLESVIRRGAHWPWLFIRLFPLARIADLRVILASYMSGGHDYRESLRDCETPVTVMVGMRSPLYAPAGQMHIAELVRDGRVVKFERSGHVPLIDEPVKFVRELGRFLHGN